MDRKCLNCGASPRQRLEPLPIPVAAPVLTHPNVPPFVIDSSSPEPSHEEMRCAILQGSPVQCHFPLCQISMDSMEERLACCPISPWPRILRFRGSRGRVALNDEQVYASLFSFCTPLSLGKPEAEWHLDVHLLQQWDGKCSGSRTNPKPNLGYRGPC